MKRTLMILVSMLFPIMAANAVIFELNLFGYEHQEKDLRKYYDKCIWSSWVGSMKLSEKNYIKLKESYEQYLKKYPEERYVTMLYFGYCNVARICPLANREEGLRLMQEALPNLSGKVPQKFVAKAAANIGYCYLKGIGTKKDEQKSFTYYKKAFDLDSTFADNLAYLYYIGIGTHVDEDRAFSLLKYGYEKGVSQIGIPYSYESKRFIYTDCYEKLFSILMLEKDDVDRLAKKKYKEGLRSYYVDKDYGQARMCFENAAGRGLPNAMYELGLLYYWEEIEGMSKKDLKEKGMQWLAKAAEANYYPAIYKQGEIKINVNGVFVAQDNKAKADAYPYFKQLADIGYGPAIVVMNNYEKYGWPKQANLFGDIAKGALSVAAMAGSIKNDGVAAGLTSQMHNTGEQYGEIHTVDDFIGAFQIQNEQMKAKKRKQTTQEFSTLNEDVYEEEFSEDNNSSYDGGYASRSKMSSTKKTSSKSSSASGAASKSSTANSTSSNNNKTKVSSTRNCRKCGGSGKVKCQRCNGTTRMSCAGCDGRGYNTVVGAGKRKCTICYGKGTQKCTHCNGKGTEKCLGCNGRGQVNN